MDDLTAFLAARYDEAEAVARAAGGGTWEARSCYVDGDDIQIYDEGAHDEAQAAHIALNDPAAKLRDIAAKRFILADVARLIELTNDLGTFRLAERTMRHLGTEFGTHPEYRQEMGTVSAFDDYFAKMTPDAVKWLDEQVPPGYRRDPRDPFGFALTRMQEPGKLDAALIPGPELHAAKLTSYIDVPDELLMDYGAIPDTRPKPPPLPWRWRLRNRISDWRERAARRAYKIIAGEWPGNREDDW